MNTLESILAIISVISFGIALLSMVRQELSKANEAANVEMLKERLNTVGHEIDTLIYGIDAIVQVPKRREVTIKEIQDMARIARGHAILLRQRFSHSRKTMDRWRFGKLLESNHIGPLVEKTLHGAKEKKDQECGTE